MAQNQTSWSFRPIKDCRGPLPIVELDRWYWLALGRAETMRFGNLSLEFLRYAHRLKQLSSPVWSYGFNSTKRNKNSHIKLTQRVWERERERERERAKPKTRQSYRTSHSYNGSSSKSVRTTHIHSCVQLISINMSKGEHKRPEFLKFQVLLQLHTHNSLSLRLISYII